MGKKKTVITMISIRATVQITTKKFSSAEKIITEIVRVNQQHGK